MRAHPCHRYISVPARRRAGRRGFSLLELVFVVGLSVPVLIAAYAILASSLRTFGEVTFRSTRGIETRATLDEFAERFRGARPLGTCAEPVGAPASSCTRPVEAAGAYTGVGPDLGMGLSAFAVALAQPTRLCYWAYPDAGSYVADDSVAVDVRVLRPPALECLVLAEDRLTLTRYEPTPGATYTTPAFTGTVAHTQILGDWAGDTNDAAFSYYDADNAATTDPAGIVLVHLEAELSSTRSRVPVRIDMWMSPTGTAYGDERDAFGGTP